MKLSTRGRYGTRALLDIALHNKKGPILLKDIAERQDISVRYLEHLVTPLIAGGILRSTRGPRGGVELVKSPEKIKLSDIMQLLEGPVSPVECVINPAFCKRSPACATRDVWTQIKGAVDGVLESMTLQDLVSMQRSKQSHEGSMYFI